MTTVAVPKIRRRRRERKKNKAAKEKRSMSVIRGWRERKEMPGSVTQGKEGPVEGEAPRHRLTPEPYFSLKRRDGRLRGCVCMRSHICTSF